MTTRHSSQALLLSNILPLHAHGPRACFCTVKGLHGRWLHAQGHTGIPAAGRTRRILAALRPLTNRRLLLDRLVFRRVVVRALQGGCAALDHGCGDEGRWRLTQL